MGNIPGPVVCYECEAAMKEQQDILWKQMTDHICNTPSVAKCFPPPPRSNTSSAASSSRG